MSAAIYDGLVRKKTPFLTFLLIGAGLLTFVGLYKAESVLYFYLLLCFYYNGFVKSLGAATQWKLLWSLPLKDKDLLGGMAISLVILGIAMNGLLWLFSRIWLDIPVLLLLLTTLMSLFTDLFTMGMQLISKKAVATVVVIVWMMVMYGLPLLIRREQWEALALWFSKLPSWLMFVPLPMIYLIGLLILYLIYHRFKMKYDLAQSIS